VVGQDRRLGAGLPRLQYTAEAYQPEKPVREIQAFVFLRRTKGKAWFDNVFIHRGGLHATQLRVMSDFPRRPHGQRIRARLTEEADWRAVLLDPGGRELVLSEGHGQTIVWDWQEPAESHPAALHLTGQARDGERLDLTIPVSVPKRSENPIREGYVVWGENSMRKVYPTEFPPSERRAELAVSLARNESEGLQLAITAADRVALHSVQVSIGSLMNERGEVFPPEAVTTHLVGYVYVETPSGHPAAPATSNWCPEVLLPMCPFEWSADGPRRSGSIFTLRRRWPLERIAVAWSLAPPMRLRPNCPSPFASAVSCCRDLPA